MLFMKIMCYCRNNVGDLTGSIEEAARAKIEGLETECCKVRGYRCCSKTGVSADKCQMNCAKGERCAVLRAKNASDITKNGCCR